MARRFDAFARQLEIGRLKRKLKEQKFEEGQKGKIRSLRQETFERSPTGKILSKAKTGAKRLSDLTLKTLKTPKGKGKKVQKLKAFFGETPKDVFGSAPETQIIGGELIGSPFPEKKKKNKDSFF